MVVFDPYDWQIHEDPYPIYARLRDEAPVYHNEKFEDAVRMHSSNVRGFAALPIEFGR